MDSSRKIDWQSSQSHIFLNPKISPQERNELERLSEEYARPGIIWIASSGSTKATNESVKLIALSKSAFLVSGKAVNQHLQSTSADIWLQCLPQFHVGGLSIYARAYLENARVIDFTNWQAEEFCKLCEQEKATLTAMVSTQLFDLVNKKLPAPKSLRALVLGGGKLETKLYQDAVDLGWPVLPSFGMTEVCSQIATAKLNSWKNKDQRLILLNHIQAKAGVDKILKIKSPALMEGYARIKEGRSEWTEPFVDGWLQTQDLVEIRGSEIIPLGRAANYIKVLGEGVDLDLIQQKFDQLLGSDLDALKSEFYITSAADERSGQKIIIAIHQQASQDAQTKLRETVETFNLKVLGYERIRDIRMTEVISWKRKSPSKW